MSSRKSEYPGLRTNGNRRKKYESCEYREIWGGTARLLTDVEIDELQAHIERLRNPTFHGKPK
jgi:hypothetical protein